MKIQQSFNIRIATFAAFTAVFLAGALPVSAETTVSSNDVATEVSEEIEDEMWDLTPPLETEFGVDKHVLLGGDWTEIYAAEMAEIPIPNEPTAVMRYHFGTRDNVGVKFSQTTESGPLTTEGDGYRALKVGNASLFDGSKYIGSLLSSKDSLFSTPGVILAHTDKNHTYIPQPDIDDMDNSFHMYRRTQDNGLTEYKVIYKPAYLKIIGLPHRPLEYPVQIELGLAGLPTGRVRHDVKVVNKAATTIPNLTLANSVDTALAEKDDVPIYFIGNNKGLYIDNTGSEGDDRYRLTYEFTGDNQPDNWTGGKWVRYRAMDIDTGEGKSFYDADDATGVFVKTKFKQLNSVGDEARNGQAGELALTGRNDTGIHMKNQPRNLAPGDGDEFSYTVGIDFVYDGPEIKLGNDVVLDPNRTTDYTVEGTWLDITAPSVDLYYQFNDEPVVKFADNVNNIGFENTEHPFSFDLAKEKLTTGKHKVTVYGISSLGEKSKPVSMQIDVKGQITLKYENTKGEKIKDDAVKYGLVKSELREKAADIADHTFSHVKEPEFTNDNGVIVGEFADKAQTVTLVYEEIIRTVTMTVEYQYVDGRPIVDVATGLPVAKETKTLNIGEKFEVNEHLKNFNGYKFNKVSGAPVNVPANDFTVIYHYDGKLELQKVDQTIDFGSNNLISNGSRIIRPLADTSVEIFDTRGTSDDWELGLRIKGKFQNQAGKEFKGGLYFTKQDGQSVELTDTRQVIYVREQEKLGLEEITWDKDDNGLHIKQLPGNTKASYSATLEWQLTNGL